MKKILSEKSLAFFLVFIAFVVSGYLYQQGRITFLPQKNGSKEVQNVVVEIPFIEKEYRLSLEGQPLDSVNIISRFEEEEDWQGDGEINFADFYEGESSLSLSSQNHAKSAATLILKESLNFSDYSDFRLFINVQSDPDNIEDLAISFLSLALKTSYRYPIRGLQRGWNFLVIPAKSFFLEGSETVISGFQPKVLSFELVSRPKTAVSLSIDFMWDQKGVDYLQDWNVSNDKMISLGKDSSGISFLVNGSVANIANLRAITSAKNYSVSAKFTPLKTGFFGFFLRSNYKDGRGYYLGMDGVGTNGWQIYKVGNFNNISQQNISLAKGQVDNFEMKKDQNYWLKAETEGSRLILSISTDGISFSKVGEASDNSYLSGGVGIVANNSLYLVDDFQFSPVDF